MATIIQKASKGQRSAMTVLYDRYKQQVYMTARCLFMNETQAENITVSVFREVFVHMKDANIATEERFGEHLIGKTVAQCRAITLKKNPKAFRIPPQKNFIVPANLLVKENAGGELDYLITNLPALQRYIFVMHTVASMDVMQIARSMKLDSKTVRRAMEAEAANIKRLQQLCSKSDRRTYEEIIEEVKRLGAESVFPGKVDEQVKNVIDVIATPVEAKERAKRNFRLVIGVLAAVCLITLVLCFIFSSGDQNILEDTETTISTDEQNADAGSNKDAASHTQEAATQTEPTEAEPQDTATTVLDQSLTYYADIEIEKYGTITVALDPGAAPITVANFVELAQSGFYDGLTFHRIMEGFMMQGGDPEGNGTGGAEETIVGEFSANGYENTLSHTRGAISMARANDYNSASSQFFIVHEDATESLDGSYAAFGYVTEGMDVVDAVCQAAEPTDGNGTIPADAQPVITSVTIWTEPAQ